MTKFLSQYSNCDSFFKELIEDDVFVYSYHDYGLEDVLKLAEGYGIKVEPIQKGTEDYKKYGECAVKVTERSGNGDIYEYETTFGEVFSISAKSEKAARLKLIAILLEKGYVSLKKVINE